MNKCIIVVPIHKEHMTNDEKQSLLQLKKVLGGTHQVALVSPENVNVDEYHDVWGGQLLDFKFDTAFFKDRMTYGIMAPYGDMNGGAIFTRSEEERKICTWLSSHGVDF